MTPKKAAAYKDAIAPIIRTWKRDGHTNVMDLEAAVKNLVQHAIGYSEERTETMRRADIVERLLAGEVVETKTARFHLAGVE